MKKVVVGLIVAGVALVSLGGYATAARLIRAKDIADSAVRSRHIKDASIREKDLADAVTEKLNATGGEQGPPGLPGPQGPEGPQGPAGPPGGIGGYQKVTAVTTWPPDPGSTGKWPKLFAPRAKSSLGEDTRKTTPSMVRSSSTRTPTHQTTDGS
jgi:hypothetical protein